MSAEKEPQRSRAAGACVVAALGVGAVAVVIAVSPTFGVLAAWVIGAGALWRSVRRTRNPSPPPPDAPPENTKPQFTAVADEENPHRTHIVWHPEEVA